jgi:CTD kinase subunit gamma CTK3
MDPFEVRMQFLSLIRKLNASALLSSPPNLRLTQPHQLPTINPESCRLRPQVLLPVR